MAQKILKIRSNESGNFSAGSLVSIDIPSSVGFLDMTSSYLLFENITLSESVNGAGGVAAEDNPKTMLYLPAGPLSLLNQLRLEAPKTGTIEEIINADVLGSNLYNYKYNRDEQDNMARIYGMGTYPLVASTTPNAPYTRTSVFSNPTTIAASGVITAGAKVTHNAILPLSTVLGLEELPNILVGGATMRLNFASSNMKNIYPIAPEVDTLIAGGLNAGRTIFTSTATTYTNANIPFYIGQVIQCYDNSGANPVLKNNATITALAIGGAGNNQLVVTFSAAVDAAVDTILYDYDNSTFSFSCTGVQLVAYENVLPLSDSQKLAQQVKKGAAYPFYTWKTDIESTNSDSTYSHTYILEPNVAGVVSLIPSAPDQLMSTRSNGLESYRLAVDNVDLVEREIYISDSLNHDRLIQTMKACNEPIKSLYLSPSNYYNNLKSVIASPITPADKMKKLSLNASGAAIPSTNVYLFKKVMRELLVKENVAQIV